ELAKTHGATTTQIALAWLLHQAPNIVLIPGTTTISHLEENIKAVSLQLSEAELSQINQQFVH
ncbi:MAG: aldo/keto reductase, partial [Cyanobacteria bacterium J06576_12]